MRIHCRISVWLCLLAGCVSIASGAGAATILPDSDTTNWMSLLYPLTDPDPITDQQTGIKEADIVGDFDTPALYWQFDDAGTADMTDGTIGFRVRVAADSPPPGWDGFFMIGIDADFDDVIDIFLGVDNRGASAEIGIYAPGTGGNTGPSDTSLVTPGLQTYTQTATNYDWSAVDNTINPGVATTDFDGLGNNDYFLTFTVSFNAIVLELANSGITLTDETKMQLIAATSNQSNALNQDLGGIDGGINAAATWAALGGFSNPVAPAIGPVPEPSTSLLVAMGLLALAGRRRAHGAHSSRR